MRHWELVDSKGFRQKIENTLLGVDPVLPTVVFGITKFGALPNEPGVNSRNIWHSTLSITEHINRPRAPKGAYLCLFTVCLRLFTVCLCLFTVPLCIYLHLYHATMSIMLVSQQHFILHKPIHIYILHIIHITPTHTQYTHKHTHRLPLHRHQRAHTGGQRPRLLHHQDEGRGVHGHIEQVSIIVIS